MFVYAMNYALNLSFANSLLWLLFAKQTTLLPNLYAIHLAADDLIRIQYNCKRSVIDQRDFHICTKYTGLDICYGLLAFGNDIFVHFLCKICFSGFGKGWPVAFPAVCVQRKLGN